MSSSTPARGPALIGLTLIFVVMVWLAAMNEAWRYAYYFTGQQDDYYSLLVHGFLKGHLSMELPAGGTSTPLDVSIYHGKYYLYFGVVPAALVFLPYRLLTGQDLSENAVCLGLVLLGFLLYLRLYAEARRRYFPALSRPLQAGTALLLAFGAGTPFLLIVSHWYEVAIAGGYACMAAGWLAMFRAWHDAARRPRWLGLASLALGLAAGCRPNYIFALPALALLALVLARKGKPANWAGLAAAAALPAAAVGSLLMAYNYARFGSPFEFGFRYQASALVAGGLPIARPSFFWPNLQWYYLRPPAFSPYFPYLFPMNAGDRPTGYYGYEPIHGQWLLLWLALLCASGFWLRRRAPGHASSPWPGFFLLPGAAFLCLFLSESFFGFRADRYLVDFQGSLVLLLALAGGSIAASPGSAWDWARAWRVWFGVLAASAGLFNVLAGLQLGQELEQPRPHTYRFLSHYGDYPSLLLARLGLVHYGPVRLQVVFAPVAKTVTEPLLATGRPEHTDVLHVIERPPNLVEFQLDHAGRAGPRSRAIAVNFDRPHDVEVDLGSLYPPKIHPYFDGWNRFDVDLLKSTARVRFDGADVIYQKTDFFDAPPNWVFLGRNPAGTDAAFGGKILAWRRLGVRAPAALEPFGSTGIWRLEAGWSASSSELGQPLLASGDAGHGNLLLVQVLANQTIRFSQDQWGGSMRSSPPIKAGPGLHRIEVFAGPQVARQNLPPDWHLDPAALKAAASILRVWLDGTPVWTTPISTNQDSYDRVVLGANPQGFSTAIGDFAGSLGFLPYTAPEMRAFIERNLQESAAGGR